MSRIRGPRATLARAAGWQPVRVVGDQRPEQHRRDVAGVDPTATWRAVDYATGQTVVVYVKTRQGYQARRLEGLSGPYAVMAALARYGWAGLAYPARETRRR
jgi:hypothetical protein